MKSLLARKDLVIREEDLKSSEDKENRNKVKKMFVLFENGCLVVFLGSL